MYLKSSCFSWLAYSFIWANPSSKAYCILVSWFWQNFLKSKTRVLVGLLDPIIKPLLPAPNKRSCGEQRHCETWQKWIYSHLCHWLVWETHTSPLNLPPLTYPHPWNKCLISGLIKGKQSLISHTKIPWLEGKSPSIIVDTSFKQRGGAASARLLGGTRCFKRWWSSSTSRKSYLLGQFVFGSWSWVETFQTLYWKENRSREGFQKEILVDCFLFIYTYARIYIYIYTCI